MNHKLLRRLVPTAGCFACVLMVSGCSSDPVNEAKEQQRVNYVAAQKAAFDQVGKMCAPSQVASYSWEPATNASVENPAVDVLTVCQDGEVLVSPPSKDKQELLQVPREAKAQCAGHGRVVSINFRRLWGLRQTLSFPNPIVLNIVCEDGTIADTNVET